MPKAQDVSTACVQADQAFAALSTLPPAARAAILDAVAAALDARRDDILTTCSEETALTIDELTPEFARMTGTLRMFAGVVREGSWVRAAIDTPSPTALGPNHDIRSMLVPLGPVAVFGSSNFPLAYGVCGGDTASALAAGCPVIVKEHPAHPRTGRLLAEIAHAGIDAAREAWNASSSKPFAPAYTLYALQYAQNDDPSDHAAAQALLENIWIRGVGFTGSTAGGLALEALARQRTQPIPVFAEMGSMNCVFIAPRAFARRGPAIADELANSILTRVGQQCTKPGLIFIAGEDEHAALFTMLRDRLLASTPRRMLARTVADNYYRRVNAVARSPGILDHTPIPSASQRAEMLGVPVVFSSADLRMERDQSVWEEVFGPAVIVSRYNSSGHSFLNGGLTVSAYAEPEDIDSSFDEHDMWHFDTFADFLSTISAKAGRIILNGVPTGVRVATSMVHGGPFPSTNAHWGGHTTAVGPRAIERWCRPLCYQNCPDPLLPAELRSANPRAIWRTVNGVPQSPAAPAAQSP